MAHIAQAPSPGDIISNRYEVLEQLGVGGFGAVYKARQLGMNREIALKTLLPHLALVEGVEERFQREAQLASDLVSPHTIRLYDFGKTEQGMLYIAMELLRGEELEEALKREGALPLPEVRQISLEILDSLAEAHQHSIVHRDLKPSNIFLTEVGRNKRFVKVLDFGIAKAVTAEPSKEQKLTATGQTLGTPYYMAPEQIRGKTIGPHTDLYALGLIMLEMATGQVAVQGETPLETVLMHVSAEPVAMPDWLRTTQLGEVIGRAVVKSWEHRYQSCEQMLADLERVDATASGTAPAVGSRPQGFRPETGQLSSPQSAQYGVESGPVPQMHSGPVPIPSAGYPVQSGGYPAQSGGYPVQSGGYPVQSGAYGVHSGPMSVQPASSSGMRIVLVALIVFVLIGAGVLAALLVGSDDLASPGAAEKAQAAEGAKTTPPHEAVPVPTDPAGNGATAPVGSAGPTEPGPGENPTGDEVAVADDAPTEEPNGEAPTVDDEETPPTPAPALITITVTSDPKGAEVHLGDEFVGRTPMTFQQDAGEGTQMVTLRMSRYQDATFEVDLATGGAFEATLEKGRSRSRTAGKVESGAGAKAPGDTGTATETKPKRTSLAVDDEPPPAKKKPDPKGSLAVD